MRQKLREHAGWIFWLVVIALAVVWNSLLVFGPPRLVVRMEWEPISLALGYCCLRSSLGTTRGHNDEARQRSADQFSPCTQ
jgi:hypothetical protein